MGLESAWVSFKVKESFECVNQCIAVLVPSLDKYGELCQEMFSKKRFSKKKLSQINTGWHCGLVLVFFM